jgi:hypothetical protein
MKEVESILEPISSNFVSLIRNPMKGWFELEIGIPNTWVFDANKEIDIETVNETEVGKVIKIIPKNNNVVVDDVILFARIIISTNKKIAEKEQELKNQLEEMKKGMEKKAGSFFKELDELKENAFKKLNDSFVDELNGKKPRKKRTPKEPKAGDVSISAGDISSSTGTIKSVSGTTS